MKSAGGKVTIFFLKAIAALPFGVLYAISDFSALLLYHVVRYRRRMVRRNLTDSFPEKSIAEIKSIEKRYYRFISDVMVETVKLLNISREKLSKRIEVLDYEEINNSIDENRSVVIMLGHYANWEWVQEIGYYFKDVYRGSIYRKMSNRLWDEVFLKIRSRWDLTLLPQKSTVKALLDPRHRPWIFGFIADQRPKSGGHHYQTRFLNHDTQFITGPEDIGTRVNANFFYLDVERKQRGYYVLRFKKLEPAEDTHPYPYTRAFWRAFEQTISRDVALWLWSHNRWRVPRNGRV